VLRLLDSVWDPDSHSNADWLGASPDLAVLLDGAAPLGKQRVSGFENDAIWLVRRFVEVFVEACTGSLGGSSVLDRIEGTRRQLEAEYRSSCERAGFIPEETPFACLGVAHEAEGKLELFNMGDLSLLIQREDGSVESFGENAVRELDRQALEFLKAQIAAGPDSHDARVAQVWAHVLANRTLRNVLPGYDVLDVDTPCRNRVQTRSVAGTGNVRLLMMSDGFYRLVDTYQRYSDESLLQAVETRGLKALLLELRAIEAEDANCVRYPRFKRCDDATALWLLRERSH
jgi:hypothetical protein